MKMRSFSPTMVSFKSASVLCGIEICLAKSDLKQPQKNFFLSEGGLLNYMN